MEDKPRTDLGQKKGIAKGSHRRKVQFYQIFLYFNTSFKAMVFLLLFAYNYVIVNFLFISML